MVAVNPGHAAMAVAHVFAEANVRDDEQLRTFGLDRADGLLHHAILGVGAGGLLVLFVRDTEEEDGLQSGGAGARGFGGNFVRRKLLDARHAADRAARFDFFVHEKGENKIVRAEIGLADEVAQGGGAPQTARAMNQFPHAPRLSAPVRGSKR